MAAKKSNQAADSQAVKAEAGPVQSVDGVDEATNQPVPPEDSPNDESSKRPHTSVDGPDDGPDDGTEAAADRDAVIDAKELPERESGSEDPAGAIDDGPQTEGATEQATTENLPENSSELIQVTEDDSNTVDSAASNSEDFPSEEASAELNNQTAVPSGPKEAIGNNSGFAAPQRQLQVPDSAINRFRQWLGGSTALGKPLQNPTPVAATPEPPIASDQPEEQQHDGPSLEAATEELAAFEKSHDQWEEYVAAQEQVAQDVKNQMGQRESQLNELNNWVSQYDRSYQWRVQQRMDQQLAKAEADLRAYENSARNVEEFEAGRLVELRKQFHALIGRPTLVAILLGALIVVLPILFRIPKLDALETFYDPRLSAPIIFLVVGAVVTLVLLIRRALGKDRIQNVVIVRWILLAFFLGLVILAMPTLEVPIRNNLIPFIEDYLTLILGVIAAVILTWILIALTIYYQGWSQYRRGVENQLARLRAVISGYVETRQEVNRLSLLYQQTADWLEILAHALYRPWAVDPAWEEKRRVESDFEDFPFSLRVAQVDDQEGAKSAELERIISTKLLVQGWRAQAFDDLINHIALDLGIGVSKFNVETLDRDLPHQTNNSRNVLRGYLDASAGRDDESVEEHSQRNPHLVEVARQRLKVLIQQTQSVALSAARPSVSQLIRDPLETIDFDGNTGSRTQRSEDWDSFLKESLGTEEIIKPPLSILGLSSKGKMNKSGENPSTFILIPERLQKALPDEASVVSEIVAVSDDTARPVEIIARMDVSQPLEAVDLRLLHSEPRQGVSDQRRASSRDTKAGSICSECHDPTCPASTDSTSPCVNAGI